MTGILNNYNWLLFRNNPKLVSVIQSFAKRAKLTRGESGAAIQLTKFSELDNILLGLDASEYIPLFNQHGLNLETFLELNELDLEKIGVEKVIQLFSHQYVCYETIMFGRVT